MEYEIPDFLLAAPEIVLLAMVCVILIVDLFLSDAHRVWTYAADPTVVDRHRGAGVRHAREDVAYTFNGMFRGRPDGGRAQDRGCA